MSHRPLIPVLLFFISGIITGRIALSYNQSLYFPLIILITFILIISFIPRRFSPRLICFLFLFYLTGIFLVFNTAIQPPRLMQITKDNRKVILQGTILSPESVTQERAKFDLLVEGVILKQDIIPLREKVAVYVYENIVDLNPGQRIRFPASLRSFRNFNNPGRYDYEATMRLRGFSCIASVSDGRYIVPMGRGDLGFLMKYMEAVRGPIREFIINHLSLTDQKVYRALILGEMQDIDDRLRESFNLTGLGHVLSVSGLHVGLVAIVSYAVFRFLFSLFYSLMLRIDIRKAAAVITCLCVFAYTFITGFQVSAKRAMIMAITYLLSIVLDREKDPWSSLALAAIIILALDPNDLFNISFQLSFIAIVGIFWLSPEIYGGIKKISDNMGRGYVLSRIYLYFSSLLIITLSAVIFLTPLTTYYFHRISVIAVPINLIIEPLLGLWILPFGLLSIMFLPVSYPLSCLILRLGSYGLDGMMNIIEFWSGFSWVSFWSITPNPFEIVLCYGLIFCFMFTLKGRKWAKIGLALVLLICLVDISCWIYQTRFNRHLRVTYLDVGQGNAALIQFPGRERMLIDGGGFSMSSSDVGRMAVAPFLFHSKILRVDYLVLTHPESDHMNGLLFIASNFEPKEFWSNGDEVDTPAYDELMSIVESKKIKALLPSDMYNREREISGVKVEILHPPSGGRKRAAAYEDMDLNNNSLVLRVIYNGTSFLFPGDIEKEGEDALLSNSALKSDILLVPHHGSKGSSTMPFLRAISPEICVISSGSGNRFGFPHKETVERLRESGASIMRIDESGAIQFKVGKDGEYEVETFIK